MFRVHTCNVTLRGMERNMEITTLVYVGFTDVAAYSKQFR